jgi:hypothetical protein
VLMVLGNEARRVGTTEVRGWTISREMSHLFAVRATVCLFIRAPVVILHLSFSEEGSAQKYGTSLLVLHFKASPCPQWPGVRSGSYQCAR